jgi:hypothetical protein
VNVITRVLYPIESRAKIKGGSFRNELHNAVAIAMIAKSRTGLLVFSPLP